MDALQAIAEEAAARLGEHFAAVQILVSHPVDGGGTRCIKRGCGDWYARVGMAHEFIEQDKADEVGQSVARSLPPPDDDGEVWKKP